MIRFLVTIAVLLALPGLASAQQFPSDLFNTQIDGSVAAWIIRTFGLLTVLSVAPGILIMVTSFPRFVIAFSILRSGMGLASTPSNMILLSTLGGLAGFGLAGIVIGPTIAAFFLSVWNMAEQEFRAAPEQKAADLPPPEG